MTEDFKINFHLAQLRHAYMLLKQGSVVNQADFAEGLIAPAIRAFELHQQGG